MPLSLNKRGVICSTLLLILTFCILSPQSQAASAPAPAASKPPAKSSYDTVLVSVIGDDGKLSAPVEMPKVSLTPAEWKKKLTPVQYRILREADTELAGSGKLLNNKADGIYLCAGCDLPLYKSDTKFESGTGWPSFFQPIAMINNAYKVDLTAGMVRNEILCPRCGGHLGHVFEDGPAPTGMRYCLNSEALKFTATAGLKSIAEKIPPQPKRETIVIAGGCFWCVEGVFEQIDGVRSVISGYAGDDAATANYKAVSSGKTKHAEAVQIIYDPEKVSYEKLLKVHFATHDPTTLNRQGEDVGPQYRSTLFYANEPQHQLAQAFLEDLKASKAFKQPIVTTLEPLKAFYPAELHHQDFVCRNPLQPYVEAIALPKVEKVKEKFKEMLRPEEK